MVEGLFGIVLIAFVGFVPLGILGYILFADQVNGK